jgi:hypothetical protein
VTIIVEEEEFVAFIQAKVLKGNSMVSSQFFVCAFYN